MITQIDYNLSLSQSPRLLYKSLSVFDFFVVIKYTPEDRFKPKLLLDQINHYDTEKVNKETRNYRIL